MALTREFKETIRARAERDAGFRDALLAEAVELLLAGDLATGKAIMRDFVNATVGFRCLADKTGLPAKSLMRMLSPEGNPRADNLFAVIRELQLGAGIHLGIALQRGANRALPTPILDKPARRMA